MLDVFSGSLNGYNRAFNQFDGTAMLKHYLILSTILCLTACAGSPARDFLEGKSSMFDGTKRRYGFMQYTGQHISMLPTYSSPAAVLHCAHKNGDPLKVYAFQTDHYERTLDYVGEDQNNIYYQSGKKATGGRSLTLVFTDADDYVESVREISLLAGGLNRFKKTYRCQ